MFTPTQKPAILEVRSVGHTEVSCSGTQWRQGGRLRRAGSSWKASDVFPDPGFNLRHFRFGCSLPRPDLAGPVPWLHRHRESPTTSCRPCRASLPSRWVRSPADECTAKARIWSPSPPDEILPRRRQDLSKFLGNLPRPFAHVQGRVTPLCPDGHQWPATSNEITPVDPNQLPSIVP